MRSWRTTATGEALGEGLVTYADTSALVKIVVPEAESAAVRSYLTRVTDRTSSSELTIAELLRTTARAGGDTASAIVLLRQLDLLAVDEASLWRAGRMPSPAGTFLRTADAIHLAAAADLGEIEFLTYDRRQAQAAAERGFAVLAPGRPERWYEQPRISG